MQYQQPTSGEHRQEEHKHRSPKRILFVLTNTFVLGNTGRATGWDVEELAVPYYSLAKQHYLFFASIKGGVTQFDPASLERAKDNEYVKRIIYDDEARHHWEHTKHLGSLDPDHFDAIIFPGGHGPMFDLPQSRECQRLVTRLYDEGGIVASVCHGAAGFVHAKMSGGSYFVNQKRLTCFTDKEEQEYGLDQAVPFLLQSELEKAGALFECSPSGQGKTVVYERLITGQNPASLPEWVSSLQSLLQQQPHRHDRLEQYHAHYAQLGHPVHHGPFKPQQQQQQQPQQQPSDVSRLGETQRPRVNVDVDIQADISLVDQAGVQQHQSVQKKASVGDNTEGGLKKDYKGDKGSRSDEAQGERIPPQF